MTSYHKMDASLNVTEVHSPPSGWRLVHLEDVCERPQYGYTTSATEQAVGPHFLRITDITDEGVEWSSVPYCEISEDDEQRYLLKGGDILVARIGATTGKSFLIDEAPRAVFASYLIRIRVEHSLLPEFFYLFMQSQTYWDYVRLTKGGRLKQGINIPVLNNLPIPLPPLSEQREIARLLTTIRKARQAARNVVRATQEFKISLMNQAFTTGLRPLTGDGRVELCDSEIGPLPSHWIVKPLDSLLSVIQYGLSQLGEASGKYPILRMNSLESGEVTISNLQYVGLDSETFRKFRLNTDDLLFNRTNSHELVGKTAIFKAPGDFVFASYLLRLATAKDQLLPEFLNFYMNWPETQSRMKSLATKGVSQSNISASRLRSFPIPVPPLDEQQEIVDMLNASDRKISFEVSRLGTLQDLFQCLLRELSSGRIRLEA